MKVSCHGKIEDHDTCALYFYFSSQEDMNVEEEDTVYRCQDGSDEIKIQNGGFPPAVLVVSNFEGVIHGISNHARNRKLSGV